MKKNKQERRIDKALASFESDWSRTQIQNFIKDGHVLVNNEPAKSNYKVKEGDIIIVSPPEAIPLDIVC